MSELSIHESLALQQEGLADQLRAFSRFTMRSAVQNFPVKLTIEVDGVAVCLQLQQTRTYPVNEILHTLATNTSGYALMCAEWANQYREAASADGAGDRPEKKTDPGIAPDGA